MDSTKVACIPPSNYDFDVGFPDGEQEAFVAGWGYTNLAVSNTVTKLREIRVPMVDDLTCETKYQEILDTGDYDYDGLHNLNDGQTVCAGYPDGVNPEGSQS